MDKNTVHISFMLNGQQTELETEAHISLATLLREHLNLTGTKISCEEGECGACTVIMDSKAVNSCLVLAAEVNGRAVTTIEGLSKAGELHPIQTAFIDEGAVQCGFCTPGMVMSAKALLDENPNPSEADIKEALEGNICRCTGYVRIIKAVKAAAATLDAGKEQ